ncbi:MAG: undecaprenyl-diphosphate phosphatase [Desulfobulbaceae bacterium]|nr:undecaprenyl-diphosphate phosphatase [Desulfobulbaceae bacterium]
MLIFKAVILGIVQGLTEFLPISSSGHLVITSELLNFHHEGITFEIFLHLGSLCAVLLVYRRDLLLMIRSLFTSSTIRQADPVLGESFRWNFYIVLATLPAVVVGLFLKDKIDAIFDNILVTFSMLFITGVLMIFTRRLSEKATALAPANSLIIGTAQAMAILPGLSRSGCTIFVGLLLGLKRETAARFSFIMSIPAILGAVVLDMRDLIDSTPSVEEFSFIFAGTIASAISGYFAIILLLKIVRRGRLDWFGYYCFLVSGSGFIWYFLD